MKLSVPIATAKHRVVASRDATFYHFVLWEVNENASHPVLVKKHMIII